MKKFLAAVSMATAVLLAGAAVTEQPAGYRKAVLKNRFLELEFMPDSLGRLNQIKLNHSGRKLLLERILTKVSVDPLYEFYRSNSLGCGENFWKNYVAQRDGKSQLIRPDKNSIVFKNKWYGGLPIDVQRNSVLLPDSTMWRYEVEVFNRGQKPFYMALWYALTPDNAANSILQLPAVGQVKKHLLGNVNILKQDKIVSTETGLCAPGRNWIATVYPEEKAVLAIIAPPEEFFPDGGFYSWFGEENQVKYRSMEIIFNGRSIAPEQSARSSCIFAVFLGLSGVKDIAGVTAIDARPNGRQITLQLSAARQTAPGKMRISAGKQQYEIAIPELFPGKIHQITIANALPLSGTLPDGSKFDLR